MSESQPPKEPAPEEPVQREDGAKPRRPTFADAEILLRLRAARLGSIEDAVKAHEVLSITALRRHLGLAFAAVFVVLNLLIAVFVWWAIRFDHEMVALVVKQRVGIGDSPIDSSWPYPFPIVTSTVFMALIAGTVAQTGVAISTIVFFLFTHSRSEGQSSQ